MNTMADGAAQRLVAQIGEALFGQPGLTLMELAEKVKASRSLLSNSDVLEVVARYVGKTSAAYRYIAEDLATRHAANMDDTQPSPAGQGELPPPGNDPAGGYESANDYADRSARQPVGEPVAELREKGKRKVRAVVSQDDLHKILYLIHALKNISNKVWLKHDIHADDYRAATINDAAKVASGAIELLTRAYSALSGARADARVSRSAPGDAWIYADLNELSPHDVAILRDMRDHMAAKTMSLNDWHAFGPPVLDRVLALIDIDHAHRDAAPPAQAVDLERFRPAVMTALGLSSPYGLEREALNELLDLIDSKAVGK